MVIVGFHFDKKSVKCEWNILVAVNLTPNWYDIYSTLGVLTVKEFSCNYRIWWIIIIYFQWNGFLCVIYHEIFRNSVQDEKIWILV